MIRTECKRPARTDDMPVEEADTFAISGFSAGIRTHIFSSLVSLLDRPAIEPLLMKLKILAYWPGFI